MGCDQRSEQAVICVHDIHAIGYYLRLQEEGIRVPEEVRICSLNHSTNSMVFRPDIAGVDRQDRVMVELACELMDRLLKGERLESFSDTMVVLTGYTNRTGKLKNQAFSLRQLVPLIPQEGDLFLFYPIHNKARVYGYMVFVNETLPISIYNYRICHESLNSSIENLHRLMEQKKLVAQFGELHMRDAMTGLYNQFALQKFQDDYVTADGYIVVVIDMDGLKTINDGNGHLAGDRAICMVADVISREAEEGDLVIRYGGDEIFILSRHADEAYWKKFAVRVNELLEKGAKEEDLPYPMGVSVGCCVSRETGSDGLEHAIALADNRMYENKKQRKRMRKG